MRFSARVLAVMVLFILAGMTALADDTAKPKDAAKKSEAGSASTSATATSEAATKPQPAASALAPRPRPAPASSSSSMRGDNTPAVEAFLGYSYIRFTTDNRPIIPFPTVNIPDHFDLQGATEELTGNVTDWFGLVADFGQYNTWHRTPGVHAYTYLFGPQFSFRKNERLTPFVPNSATVTITSRTTCGYREELSSVWATRPRRWAPPPPVRLTSRKFGLASP